MKIKILGNGGFVSDGLPYNSFMIDGHFLIESPPDIMQSLFRENIDLLNIDTIFISHFHGDHYFGLPFLLLRIFLDSYPAGREIKIIAPSLVKEKTFQICKNAFGENHPSLSWIENSVTFTEINSASLVDLGGGLTLEFFPMIHPVETYAFALRSDQRCLLVYLTDTVWDDSLIAPIKLHPSIVIADMNGEPSDPVKVHLSEEDILTKAFPYASERTLFCGTHLKSQKISNHRGLRYLKSGDELDL